MIINKLNPQGFCKGVFDALTIVNKTIEDPNTVKPIYILGNIIHNKIVVNSINAITLEGNKSRYELLDQVDKGTVIITAHGVSDRVIKKAIDKGLNVIDATCQNVLSVHTLIRDYLSRNYEIIYIGIKNHPECEGVIELSNKIHLIVTIDDINSLEIKSDKIIALNQTTLSSLDIKNFYDLLKIKFPNIIINNSICNATLLRQKAVINQPAADLSIIVGDSLSSNTKKLYELSKAINKSIMVESVNELLKYDFTNIKKVNITSGASTPKYITEEIINYLENK